MHDGLMDVGPIDLGGLSPTDADSLGDSALAHAVRRVLVADSSGPAAAAEPIAAFQDCI